MHKDNLISHALRRVSVWKLLLVFAGVEVASFAVFQYTALQLPVFVGLSIAFFALAVWKLEYGVAVVLAELAIGSKGYLFTLATADFPVSIRLAFFVLLFVATIVRVIRDREIAFFSWYMWRWTAAVVVVLGFGAAMGVLRGNALSNVFLDLNGYLFFGLVFPITQALRTREQVERIIGVLLVAVLAVAIKSTVLLVLFSQTLGYNATLAAVYKWVRDTGVGEITASVDGFPRIFFQSHIYMLYLFFVGGIYLFFEKLTRTDGATGVQNVCMQLVRKPYVWYVACAVLFIFLSGSRSMWVALVAAGFILVSYTLVKRIISVQKLAAIVVVLIGIALFDFAVAYSLINLPLGGGSVSSSAILTQRTSDDNATAAVASRGALLKPLVEKMRERPVLGHGLGTTVTYQTEDPRAKEAFPEGYTTYAFEWGYLDLVVKFGLIGFIIFMLYPLVLVKRFVLQAVVDPAQLGLLMSIIALYGTHFFTPYVNHPLGVGWLLFATAAIPLLHKQRA